MTFARLKEVDGFNVVAFIAEVELQRKRWGWTGRDLNDRSGVAAGTYKKILDGSTQLTLMNAARLAWCFDLSLDAYVITPAVMKEWVS